MLSQRLEKLRFLVDEMRVAFHLTVHLSDAFVARTLARHILIRAENFIVHARALRKPLAAAGHRIEDFHRAKEAYAMAFNEYFQIARDRLGAHVQDFDFGKRVELWNSIEIIKVGYFVDGAQEIYQSLASLNIPGYQPYAVPNECSDASVQEDVRKFQRDIDTRSRFDASADPLALTRNNTSALLNTTPVHTRASQLTLIHRWVTMQQTLLSIFTRHSGIARILKGRIICDLVSFCDCLVNAVRQLVPHRQWMD